MKRLVTPILLASSLLLGCSASQSLRSPLPEPPLSGVPPLTVVYPRPAGPDTMLTDLDTVVVSEQMPDSLFAFGRVHSLEGALYVNGERVSIEPNGAWLSWTATGPVDTLDEAPDSLTATMLTPPVLSTDLKFTYDSPITGRRHRKTARLLASLNPDKPWDLPRQRENITLVVTAGNAKIRCGWPGTTYLYPAVGTHLWAVASSDTGGSRIWKLAMPGGMNGWIESEYVEIDSTGNRIPIQVVKRVGSEVEGRETRVLLPLEAAVPFDVRRINDEQLVLTLYGAVSWTDVILQPTESRVVEELRWAQPDSALYELTATIRPEWLWGWDVEMDTVDTTLVWTVIEAPEVQASPFENLTVVVDPGHGGENISAIGPTGLFESRANLELARAIAEELESAGAQVLMTRDSDTLVGLVERVDFAREWDSDLLISVHHNGLPQGANPYRSHGASLHYVHRHAKPLADAIYRELAKHGPMAGVKYQDLAMARPTWLPAVLFEAGYLLHPEEEEQARSPEWYHAIARDVRRGMEIYLLELRREQLKPR